MKFRSATHQPSRLPDPLRVVYLFGTAIVKGGGELSLLDLMTESRRHGIYPIGVVAGPGEIQVRLDAAGIEFIAQAVPPLRPWNLLSCLRAYHALKRQLSALNADVLHINGARIMLYAGLAAKALGIPCVWHVRVLERDQLLDRLRGRLANRIIVNAEATRYSLVPFITDARKIERIYNGVDLASLGTGLHPREAKHRSATPLIIAVGRLSPEKGYADLVAACAALKREGVAFTCRIIGNTPPGGQRYVDALRRQCTDQGLGNHVEIGGWEGDIAKRMDEADILVLPSRREAFGRVIVEAWNAGLPVIATRSGGPGELITDGQTGLLVPIRSPDCLAEAIERLLRDERLQNALRQAGSRKVMEFSLAEHARKVRSLYAVMLDEEVLPEPERLPDQPR